MINPSSVFKFCKSQFDQSSELEIENHIWNLVVALCETNYKRVG